MFKRSFFLLSAALALAMAPALEAAGVFTVTGVVRAPLDAGRIVVAHQAVAGYMPAMTMGFDVAGAAMLQAASLKAGDEVTFTLHVNDQHTLADHFRVLGHGAATAGAERAPGPEVKRLQVGDTVPDFALVDEAGRPVTRATLAGKLTLLTFIYTRCPVPQYCPLMSRKFGEVQQAVLADPKLNGHVALLSITLDPAFDRPAVLQAYGHEMGANPAVWHFGTGKPEKVRTLINEFSVYAERNGILLDHTLCTALLNGDGRILDIWRGNDWTRAEVLKEMTAAR